jgi:hypothetical protein
MIIRFERTGGFAGLSQRAIIDSEKLAPQEKQSLHHLVEAASFFELPAQISAPGGGADRFSYRLHIETQEKSHTIEVSEAAVPEPLQPLIQQLSRLARRRPARPG